MKKLSLILVFALCVSLLAGCAGTPVVYYTDCTCPANDDIASGETVTPPVGPVEQTPAAPAAPAAEGALKTGLYITTDISGSKDAAADAEGEAKYEMTMVAVLVDDNGVIQDCIIDGINASVKFDAKGALTTDLTAPIQTKNELGPAYNMVTYGNAIAEWNEQAAAFAGYVVGKTVAEVEGIAVDENTKPTEADLASSVTIKVGGYIEAIKAAVANAQHLGAEAGHTLKLAAEIGVDGSKAATAEEAGLSELYVNVTALTMNGDVISSCVIDAVQGKINFDAKGVITTDLTAPVQTKNELGPAYNMVTYGNAIAEWNEQAASFASYITGKTVAEVQGIAVDGNTKPTEADLVTSVTIKIGEFQSLIAKAAQ